MHLTMHIRCPMLKIRICNSIGISRTNEVFNHINEHNYFYSRTNFQLFIYVFYFFFAVVDYRFRLTLFVGYNLSTTFV